MKCFSAPINFYVKNLTGSLLCQWHSLRFSGGMEQGKGHAEVILDFPCLRYNRNLRLLAYISTEEAKQNPDGGVQGPSISSSFSNFSKHSPCARGSGGTKCKDYNDKVVPDCPPWLHSLVGRWTKIWKTRHVKIKGGSKNCNSERNCAVSTGWGVTGGYERPHWGE